MYAPNPVDTSSVMLAPDLQHLVEHLAANAHDVWAEARLAQGWKWGPSRCDVKLHHPCLVPYADLPDSEREFDRRAVSMTLKVVLALGYQISKK
jgi:hypothetical protein